LSSSSTKKSRRVLDPPMRNKRMGGKKLPIFLRGGDTSPLSLQGGKVVSPYQIKSRKCALEGGELFVQYPEKGEG